MLKHLTLKNFVLVETLDIAFDAGLTTITGESGAGKSILLNALGLLLGDRAKTDTIRPGADKADVSAEFDLSSLPDLARQLADDELDADAAEHCIVRRVVSNQGRSRAFINGIPVTTAYLKTIGEQLVDIHGQNEHLRLANRRTQLSMLDDYAGTQKDVLRVSELFDTWQQHLAQITSLQASQAAAADRQELLRYQLSELDELGLQANEFSALTNEHKRLANAQATLDVINKALDALEELDGLRSGVAAIAHIDDDHATLKSAQDNLATAMGLFDDASRDLRHYEDQVVLDPAGLADIEDRLNTVQDLARKHRINPDQLMAHVETLRAELDGFAADGDTLKQLQVEVDADYARFAKLARSLSNKRKKAAPKFAKAVAHYMDLLGIKQGDFAIAFEATETSTGLDKVEFQVTTNPSFPAGPLTQIASGGEQTRIALSIQIVAAENSSLPSLVLDEADVGVGGTTADTVGRILRDLGFHTQVICVTHAPQVAALGNNHFRVVKQGNNTDIHTLDQGHRIEELARMLAGANITDKTREYAESLLHAASE